MKLIKRETGFYRLQNKHYFNKKKKNVSLTWSVSKTLNVRAKKLLHLWSYDF